MFVLFSAKLIF